MQDIDISNKSFFSDLDDYDKMGFLLWKLNNYWQREFKKNFAELDLTHSQVLLLLSIMWEEEQKVSVTQKTLSDRTGIDPMTTSTVLRTLQKKRLIRRKLNRKDSRTRLISLTEEGKEMMDKTLQVTKKFNRTFFLPLQEQQKQFQENLIALLYADDTTRRHLIQN